MSPPGRRQPRRDTGADVESIPPTQPKDTESDKAAQWAIVPLSLNRDRRLNSTDRQVFAELSGKAAGRERIAWISQATIAERLEMRRETVHRSIKRLVRHGYVQVIGSVTVNRELGTWVRRYLVAPFPLAEQPVVTPGVTSVSDGQRPDVRFGGPDVTSYGPDVTPGSHTFIALSSNPFISEPARVVENQNGKAEEQERIGEKKRLHDLPGLCPRCPDECIGSWHRKHLLREGEYAEGD